MLPFPPKSADISNFPLAGVQNHLWLRTAGPELFQVLVILGPFLAISDLKTSLVCSLPEFHSLPYLLVIYTNPRCEEHLLLSYKLRCAGSVAPAPHSSHLGQQNLPGLGNGGVGGLGQWWGVPRVPRPSMADSAQD